MKQTQLGEGDKTHIALKTKGFIAINDDKTEFDLDIDLVVDQMDYKQFVGAIVHAVKDEFSNGSKTRPVQKT